MKKKEMITIDDIKKMTLRALMSDEILMQGLVLKGGNALQLAYDITSRGSIDIDFSMDKEFSELDFSRLTNVFKDYLNNEFNKEGFVVFDVKFIKKPKQGSISEWKGYLLEFKIIEKKDYEKFKNNIDAIRRNSIKVKEQSTRYTVDISAYEYIEGAKLKDIDGLILRVYTPEMILIEKVRALCQTMKEYKKIVTSANQKKRARDLYDIWKIKDSFKNLQIDKELFQNIFAAKQVPIVYLNNLEDLREHNRNDWDVVKQTINNNEELKDYDFYFDFLLELVAPFIDPSDKTDSNV